MKNVLVSLVVILLLGCNNSPKTNKEFINVSYSEIIFKLGDQYKENDLLVSKTFVGYEYQNNIINVIPIIKKDDTIMVKEMVWEKKDHTIVVWLIKRANEWYSIDHLEFSSDIVY